MSNEIWKPITHLDVEGYHAGSLGRIRKPDGNITEPYMLRRNNYLGAWICNTNHPKKGRSYKVHQLIARTFLEYKEGWVVNHKNGVKTDNRLENLEYVTPEENSLHAWDLGLTKPPPIIKGENHYLSKMSDTDREEAIVLYKNGETVGNIAKKYNVVRSCISNLLVNRGIRESKKIKVTQEVREYILTASSTRSASSIARELGLDNSYVSKIVKGVR